MTPSQNMLRELGAILGSEHVLTSFPDRLAYNNDCWPRGIILARGRRLKGHLPAAILQPADAGEVARIVEWARKTSTPLIPYGAGSGVCGGTLTDGQGVIVDLKRMKSIVSVRKADMTMRAQSGIIGMNMERELQRRGFTLGHFPSSLICSSLGGYLAARSAGQYSSRYGKIEDMVASMQVVTGSGEVFETAPNPLAAHPRAMTPQGIMDLTQLFVGSEGTLGLITESTLHISPLPRKRHYRGFHFDDVEGALGAIKLMMQQGLRPTVVRLYDAFDTLIAKRGKSDDELAPSGMLERVGSWLGEWAGKDTTDELKGQIEHIARGLLGRILGQPLLLNRMIEALPTDCLLIVGFEGDGEAVRHEAEYAWELLDRFGFDLGEEPGLHWLENRFNVSYKMSPMFASGAFVDTMEVSTTWANLPNLYSGVRKAMAEHVLVMAHFSHVYPEGASIYFTFAGVADTLDETLERYDRTWRAGLDAVAASGASIAHHHGVGLSKSPWTHHDHPGGAPLFSALKSAFDPDSIMNPGKVWPQGGHHDA